MRKSIVLWLMSVAGAAAVSSVITAQVQPPRVPLPQVQQVQEPRVLTGNDIGFRVDGQKRQMRRDPATGRQSLVDVPTGQFVVRINGEWVEPQQSSGVRRLTE